MKRLEVKEEISKEISGTSVVIDTCMFCTTVITLLKSGVERVKPVENLEGDYDCPVGGEVSQDLDFGNSPQSVWGYVTVVCSSGF